MKWFSRTPTIQITEDEIVRKLSALPKGILIGMLIEAFNHACKAEKIDPGLGWYMLFEHSNSIKERKQ